MRNWKKNNNNNNKIVIKIKKIYPKNNETKNSDSNIHKPKHLLTSNGLVECTSHTSYTQHTPSPADHVISTSIRSIHWSPLWRRDGWLFVRIAYHKPRWSCQGSISLVWLLLILKRLLSLLLLLWWLWIIVHGVNRAWRSNRSTTVTIS